MQDKFPRNEILSHFGIPENFWFSVQVHLKPRLSGSGFYKLQEFLHIIIAWQLKKQHVSYSRIMNTQAYNRNAIEETLEFLLNGGDHNTRIIRFYRDDEFEQQVNIVTNAQDLMRTPSGIFVSLTEIARKIANINNNNQKGKK